MPRPAPSRVAAALDYLERLKNQAAEFGGGVVENLADRARSVGGLAYEALTSDPAIGRMTTAEYAQAADRPTPRLDQAARDIGTIGRAIVTQPIQTGKAIVQGEVERAREAMSSPRAAGEYAGSFIDPMRIAAALRRTAPVLELDVYHGTPHRFPATEANPLGEFDASKIGTGEGAQAYGHGVYLAEAPEVAEGYKKTISQSMTAGAQRRLQTAGGDLDKAIADTEARAAKYRQGGAKSYAEAAEEDLRGLRQFKETGEWTSGSLYKADLPDEMIDRMLDWDKPFGEQSSVIRNRVIQYLQNTGNISKTGLPEKIKIIQSPTGKYVAVEEGLPKSGNKVGWENEIKTQIPEPFSNDEKNRYRKLEKKYVQKGNLLGNERQELKTFRKREHEYKNKINELAKNYEKFFAVGPKTDSVENAVNQYWNNMLGQDIYNFLQKNSETPEKISEKLRQIGIPGIKYLDAGSRGQGGSGTRNFVVFPGEEKKVKILERK